MAAEYFTNLEGVVYSTVEYIPYVGTIYSLKRAGIAYTARDWGRHWQSVFNLFQCAVRDAILISGAEEVLPVVVVHAMADSLTDELVKIYSDTRKEAKIEIARETKMKIEKEEAECISKEDHSYVLVTGNSSPTSWIFQGIAKGVHHFHGARFTGEITHPKWAPNGVPIQLHMPQGLFNGAQVTLAWKWAKNYWGKRNAPVFIVTQITLSVEDGTTFVKSTQTQGVGWPKGEGYYLNCRVELKTLTAWIRNFKDGNKSESGSWEEEVKFTRVEGT